MKENSIQNIDIKNLKVAKRYAKALIELSKDDLESVLSNLEIIKTIIFENPNFAAFFSHPVIPVQDKKDTIESALRGKISDTVLNFVGTLLDENRFLIFDSIYELFKKEFDIIKNRQSVKIISAVELEENEKKRLEEKLSKKLQKEVILSYKTDEDILGGLVIKLDDKVIDLSLKTRFAALKKQ